jgi:cell division protein ZapA
MRERIAVLAALNMAFDIADREANALATLAAAQTAQEQAEKDKAAAAALSTSKATSCALEVSTDELQRLQHLIQRLDSALDEPGI